MTLSGKGSGIDSGGFTVLLTSGGLAVGCLARAARRCVGVPGTFSIPITLLSSSGLPLGDSGSVSFIFELYTHKCVYFLFPAEDFESNKVNDDHPDTDYEQLWSKVKQRLTLGDHKADTINNWCERYKFGNALQKFWH